MSAENNQPLRRAIRYLWVLQGHSFGGLRLKQIGDALSVTMSMAHRDLAVLAEEGVVERVPGKEEFWRLTPKPIQLARAHEEEMTRLRQQIDQFDQRYTRNPR
ncbi:hypothetical protein [Chitinimonas sp.]|uniref:hypothetical protein n=1 Tax=Chitinimonas sp. TaxID=1934313 RepID=UPI0035AFD26D